MTTLENTSPKNGLATVSLVIGILSALVSFFLAFAPLWGALLGLIAIVLGVMALGQIKVQGAQGRGQAIAGIVLGALGILWVIVYFFVLGPIIYNTFQTINNSLNNV